MERDAVRCGAACVCRGVCVTRADLLAACAALGWTVRGLARMVGVSENTACGWGKPGRPVPDRVSSWLRAEMAHRDAHPAPRVKE